MRPLHRLHEPNHDLDQALKYRPHIDGIRAIAVLAVVLYHADVPGFPGGYVGVDVFFVISGYLISGLLLQEIEATGDISVRGFVERRIRRLAPALFVVLLATLVAGMILLSPIGGEQQSLAKSAIATVLLSANIYFWRHTGGYFDAPSVSFPLLHTWTLSVEEQFYLVWPWLLLLAWAFAARMGFDKRRTTTAVLVAVFVVSLALSGTITAGHPQAAFFLMPFRAWEFAAGGMAIACLRWRQPAPRMAESIAVLGLLAVVLAIMRFDEQTVFPGWMALVPVLGSAALIYGSEANPSGVTARLLSIRPMVFFGLISYSLYLWHWPILSIARTIAIDEIEPEQALVLCLAAVVLAWMTYRFVEHPIRSLRLPWMATRVRTFRLGAAMMSGLVIVALGLGIWSKSVWPRLPGNADKAARFAAIRKPDWGCDANTKVLAADGSLRGCLMGKPGPVRMLLWGDSHAAHLTPVLEALAATTGERAMLRYFSSCPPAIGYWPKGWQKSPDECPNFNRDVLAYLDSRKSIDTVILSARWMAYSRSPELATSLADGLKQTVRQLHARGIRVLLVAPGADFLYEVPACLVRHEEAYCDMPRTAIQARRTVAMAIVRSAAQQYPDVMSIDPLDSLCTSSQCPASDGRAILYIDSHHLSVAGAERLIPAFIAKLQRVPSDG